MIKICLLLNMNFLFIVIFEYGVIYNNGEGLEVDVVIIIV